MLRHAWRLNAYYAGQFIVTEAYNIHSLIRTNEVLLHGKLSNHWSTFLYILINVNKWINSVEMYLFQLCKSFFSAFHTLFSRPLIPPKLYKVLENNFQLEQLIIMNISQLRLRLIINWKFSTRSARLSNVCFVHSLQ